MSDRTININVKHSFDYGKSNAGGGGQINKDFKAQMKAFSQIGASIRSSAGANASLVETLKATNKALEKSLRPNPAKEQSQKKVFKEALSSFKRSNESVGSDFAGGTSSSSSTLYRHLKDFNSTIGGLGKDTKKYAREYQSLMNEAAQMNKRWFQRPNSPGVIIGSSVVSAGLIGAGNLGSLSAGYASTAQTGSIQNLGQLTTDYNNQFRSSIAQGVQFGLSAIGAAVGGAFGGAPGAIGGGLAGDALSLPFQMWAAGTNAANQQSYATNLLALQAKYGFGNLNSSLVSQSLGKGVFTQSIGTPVTSRINSLIASGHGYEIGPYVAAGGAFRRYGSGVSSSVLSQLSAYGQLDPSMNIAALASSVAFINHKTGRDMIPRLGFLANITGSDIGTTAQRVAALMGGSSLNTYSKASNFLSNTAALGDQFQQTASGYVSSGPTSQFQTKFMLKSLFGVDADKIFTAGKDGDAERAKLKAAKNAMNQDGFPGGDMLEENVLGGAANYYAVNNAGKATLSGKSASGAVTPDQFANMLTEAVKIGIKNITTNSLHVTASKVNFEQNHDVGFFHTLSRGF